MSDKRVKMVAKYPGMCAGCLNNIKKGRSILWCPDTRAAWHEGCKDKTPKKKKLKTNSLVAARPARGRVRFHTF